MQNGLLITCRVAEFPNPSLLFHSWCVHKVMLSMMNNRSTAIFGCSCHPPEGYNSGGIREKVIYKKWTLYETRVADRCVVSTSSTLNPFTEKSAEFLYRE